MYGADFLAIPLAFWSAVVVKADRLVVPDGRLWALFLVAAIVALAIFQVGGLYRLVVRFIVPRAGLAILVGTAASMAAVAVADQLLPGPSYRDFYPGCLRGLILNLLLIQKPSTKSPMARNMRKAQSFLI